MPATPVWPSSLRGLGGCFGQKSKTRKGIFCKGVFTKNEASLALVSTRKATTASADESQGD